MSRNHPNPTPHGKLTARIRISCMVCTVVADGLGVKGQDISSYGIVKLSRAIPFFVCFLFVLFFLWGPVIRIWVYLKSFNEDLLAGRSGSSIRDNRKRWRLTIVVCDKQYFYMPIEYNSLGTGDKTGPNQYRFIVHRVAICFEKKKSKMTSKIF